MRAAPVLVFAVSALLLGVRAGAPPLGHGYLDFPVTAQDEAVYSSAAIAMAEPGGDWSTPVFLGRYFLYKPPLLYWLGAGSAKIFGVSARVLRLPSVLAASLTAALVFACVALAAGISRAAMAVALLHFSGLFQELARRNMTDALVMAAIVSTVWLLLAGGRVEWVAAPIAVAILAKSVAGAIPVFILLAWWIAERERPAFPRVALTIALGVGAAAPWFVYHWIAHRRWFEAEFIGIELLAYGASAAAPQTSAESAPWFYLKRLWQDGPALALVFLSAVPARFRGKGATILPVALAVMAMAILSFQYRNATYLLPLIPLLAIAAGTHAPIQALIAGFALSGYLGSRAPAHHPDDSMLQAAEQYCEMKRGNELIAVGIDDNFSIATLPLAGLRYAIRGALGNAGQVTLDFRAMGIILPVAEFNALSAAAARYTPKLLGEWGLPDASALGTVIGWERDADLAQLVAANPERDFLFPRGQAPPPSSSHTASPRNGATLLLARSPLPLPRSRRRGCRLSAR